MYQEVFPSSRFAEQARLEDPVFQIYLICEFPPAVATAVSVSMFVTCNRLSKVCYSWTMLLLLLQ